ncbi:TOMM precursor leader peptide-binding protein [uncultured Nostoc sp.]|uniref:TOMM precursor leader peptide-binding protein n=1 Tax=uncultured Nostoc sp. TaxID=340711 RepID=UPI0035CCA9EB
MTQSPMTAIAYPKLSMKIPQIKPHFRVEIVEPKNVYLLGEYATHALTGSLYCQIVPLLNGQHTLEEIIQRLDGQVAPDHIHYVLDRLHDKGYLTDAAHNLTPQAAAFWSLLNVDPQVVSDRLPHTQVFVTAVGAVDAQPLIESLQAIGISVGRGGEWEMGRGRGSSLLVVLTDDYLQPELSQINKTALQKKQPWLLVKPLGGILWFGSIFHPGETGCWECLAHRLNGNREVETSVLQQKGEQERGCLPTAFAALPSTVQAAIALTTTEVAKWLVKQIIPDSIIPTLAGKIITLDQTIFTLKTHTLTQRPQCPACGNPDLVSQQVNSAIALTSRKKLFTQDGGHRAFTPEQILQRYEHLISPITGVVSALVRISDPNNLLVHTYSATHAFGSSSNLNRLRKSLGHKSGGKGKTDRQSQASGFCEAIERYSGIYQGDEPRIKSKLADLGGAIHPAECLLFSDTQYQNRQELNQKAIVDHDWIPQLFDETQAIDWTLVWSMTEQTHKYLPTAFCYYNYRLPKGDRFCSADSNGNAAGGTLEDAILQGFLELVERDSVAIWWYNRLSRPTVDLASFNDSYLLELQDWYRSQQRELWVLDLTTDLNIPAFAALSRNIGGSEERIIAGYGAHFDPKIAISRAVTEVNQIGFNVDRQDYSTAPDSALNYWFTQATLANQPYLAPCTQTLPKQYADYPQQWSDDIQQDVLTCVEVARRAGLEMLVLNQTRPDIGLPVVKVIVPGLRHFWSRFGAGRLYNVPTKLGWRAPLTEDQMNPMPMVF